jgi:DNA-binding transcriptional LysR family regulator
MDIQQLRYFLAVAEELHFGRAAERLVYTKSHVSQIIARLERELGLPLFTRTTRQVELTAAGRRLVTRARTVLGAVEDLRREAAELAGRSGAQLRVAYAPATGPITTGLVAELTATGAARAIQIDPKPSSPHVIRAVLDGEVASRTTVTVADLDREPLILPQRDVNPELYDATVAFFDSQGVAPDYRPRHITSPAQLVELVLSRQGLAIGLKAGPPIPGLVTVPLAGPAPPGQTVYLLRRRGPADKVMARVLGIARSRPLG